MSRGWKEINNKISINFSVFVNIPMTLIRNPDGYENSELHD